MTKYGIEFADDANPLDIEMEFIRFGGYIQGYGNGLFHHYKAAQQLIWPEDDHHKWSDLMLDTVLKSRLTAITGSRDSGKSHFIARYALTDYYCFPKETLFLISSTDLRSLQLRIWGGIKDLHRRAQERYPWLAGNVLESLHGIFTDKIDDDTPIRDVRRGIIAIPIMDRKGVWLGGLQRFVGVKQKRRRLLADEAQFCNREYLDVLSNLDEGDFKAILVGNTLANRKALDVVAEPVEGWENRPQPTKTEVFKNKFDGLTIQLIGTDSPNFDVPADAPIPYPYLINRKSEARVGNRWGRDSEQYHSQISGLRKTGLFMHRVLTEDICRRGKAFEKVIWDGAEATVKVYACDMGFGGDRCIAGSCEFGRSVEGDTVFRVNPPAEIQLSVELDPEDQIAMFIKKDIDAQKIPASQVFFDAGMRATAAVTMSKLVGPDVNAVNFGGQPTKRPVSSDEYVLDQQTAAKRLKRCDEHYDRFVTELWFSVRLVALSRQLRELPLDVAQEFYEREWCKTNGDRYAIETKDEMRERTGYSPDLADWCVIALEGARRLGFAITMLPDRPGANAHDDDYLERELKEYREEMKKRSLRYTMPR